MTDGLPTAKGRIVNFKNTVVILTSNIGSEQLVNMNQIGFEETMKKSEESDKQYGRSKGQGYGKASESLSDRSS